MLRLELLSGQSVEWTFNGVIRCGVLQTCSAGAIAVQLVRDLLKANPNCNAVVVTTEVVSHSACECTAILQPLGQPTWHGALPTRCIVVAARHRWCCTTTEGLLVRCRCGCSRPTHYRRPIVALVTLQLTEAAQRRSLQTSCSDRSATATAFVQALHLGVAMCHHMPALAGL